MDYLHTFTDGDIFAHSHFEQPDVYEQRVTVKAIVQNHEGKYGLVTNLVHGLFLLPGGGAESGDLQLEAKRECREEINFEIDIHGEIGCVHEFRNREAKEYTTTCYLACTTKEVMGDARTEGEKIMNCRSNGLIVMKLSEFLRVRWKRYVAEKYVTTTRPLVLYEMHSFFKHTSKVSY